MNGQWRGDEWIINCTVCNAKPKKKYWHQSKLMFETLGSSGEFRVCPECQKHLPKDWYVQAEHVFRSYRRWLVDEIKKIKGEKP